MEKFDAKFYYITNLIWEDSKFNTAQGGETFEQYWERKREMIINRMYDACTPPQDPEYIKWLQKIDEIMTKLQKEKDEKRNDNNL